MEEIRNNCENEIIDSSFVERMIKAVKEQCGEDFNILVARKKGNNGTARVVLLAGRKGRPADTVVYLEPHWKQYQEGVSFDKIAGRITGMIQKTERFPGMGLEKMEYLLDFENIKDGVIYQLVNWEWNKEELGEIPHKRVCGNLAAVFYVLIEAEGNWQSAVKIMRQHMEIWGTDEDELWHLAERNTPCLRPAKLAAIEETIKELIETELAKNGCQLDENMIDEAIIREILDAGRENKEKEVPLYVLTNSLKMQGAAVILYPGIMEWAAEQIGGDLIILPSSVHETILLRWDGHMGECMEEVREIVHDVNQDMVPAEEILSDSIYRYRRSDGWIEWIV